MERAIETECFFSGAPKYQVKDTKKNWVESSQQRYEDHGVEIDFDKSSNKDDSNVSFSFSEFEKQQNVAGSLTYFIRFFSFTQKNRKQFKHDLIKSTISSWFN